MDSGGQCACGAIAELTIPVADVDGLYLVPVCAQCVDVPELDVDAGAAAGRPVRKPLAKAMEPRPVEEDARHDAA
jgi:hypothetical protein